MDKILTVVIPTYNMEKYLRKCLDSLIIDDKDLFDMLEVLVINDGSKDSSSDIAHQYQDKYPNVFRVIDKENGNYGSCINRGLKEATGKYIKILDADDFFDANVLNGYINFLFDQEADLVISDFNIVDEAGMVLSEFTYDLPLGRLFELKEIPTEMNALLFHQCITYKRVLFLRFDYKQTENISYTDDEWIFKPMMWIEKAVYYPHTLYLYLRGREGQTFDPKIIKRTLEQRVKVAKEMLLFYDANIKHCMMQNCSYVTDKLVKRISAVYHYHLIRFHSSENEKRIEDFDSYLKQQNPDIYDRLNNETNRFGWHYVKQWRAMGYSNYAPALLILRLNNLRKSVMGKYRVQIDRIPKHLMRQTV